MMKETINKGVIKGIFHLGGTSWQHTLSRYVDDITIYLKGKEGNLWTKYQLGQIHGLLKQQEKKPKT
jgi:hypothetical protein